MLSPIIHRRFQSTAKYYLAGRPSYSVLLIRRVADLCALNATHKILDLGSGPGPLAMAFAPFVRSVTALDPEPEMLDVGRQNARLGGFNIDFIQGDSYSLGRQLGIFQAAVIGRAFHWMDRTATLDLLDTIVTLHGAVILFDSHPKASENPWHISYQKLLEHYATDDPERQKRRSTEWVKHETVLLTSPFHQLEHISTIERRLTAVERFVDRALSLSCTSRNCLGTKANDLASEIRELMAGFAHDGSVLEVVKSAALIARRNPLLPCVAHRT
jgi:SAM-dependent methyltransferase